MTVVTDPPGATCALASARRGEPVVHVDDTPSTAKVPRDSWAIAVHCRKPGYVDVREDVDPAGQGDGSDEHRRYVEATVVGLGTGVAATGTVAASIAYTLAGSASAAGVAVAAWPVALGFVIVAPIVLAVDAMSGATWSYPPVIVLRLTPATYPDEAARDAWFAANDSRLAAADDALRKDTEANCWAACYTRRTRDEAYIAARRARYAGDRAKTAIVAAPAMAAP